jgi:hypothetical protein
MAASSAMSVRVFLSMHALPAVVSPTERKEYHHMEINFAAFHAEYWVYALAGLVMIVVGTLLYTVDGPIKFSNWF